MKNMSLAHILVNMRREKGITQDELAAHVGVSKASVSKWENGNSLPDIMLLPIIASYFDISIDRLMNYSPQLSTEEIVKTYTRLAESFAIQPFDDVISECEQLTKKYYSCFPFVIYVALLYLNHAMLATSDERKTQVLQMAIDLCEHTLNNCRDTNLLKEASQYQALCYMSIGQHDKVLELLCDESGMPKQFGIGFSEFVSHSYQMMGDIEKAKEVDQLEIYASFMAMINGLTSYIRLNQGDFETAKMAFCKAEKLAEVFDLRRINTNNAARLYIAGAHMYQTAGESERAIEILGKYVDVCTNDFFSLVTGGLFFTKIDKWFAEQREKEPLPRNETVIKESMLSAVMLDPAFDGLRENQEFNKLVKRLKNFIERGSKNA